jgi:hypothetical protein
MMMIKTVSIIAIFITCGFATTGMDIVNDMSNAYQARSEQRLLTQDLPKVASRVISRDDIPSEYKRLNINLACESLVKNVYSKIALHRHKAVLDAFRCNLITKEQIEDLVIVEPNYIWEDGKLRDRKGKVCYEFKG